MDRKDRLKAAYDHLRNCGVVHTQKAFAASLGKAEGTMSKAFKGDEKSLTDNLFVQLVTSYPGTFSLDWFLTGTGTMLLMSEHTSEEKKEQNIIDTLGGVVKDVERELADIRLIRVELQQARDDFRAATAELAKLINSFGHSERLDVAADENPRPK